MIRIPASRPLFLPFLFVIRSEPTFEGCLNPLWKKVKAPDKWRSIEMKANLPRTTVEQRIRKCFVSIVEKIEWEKGTNSEVIEVVKGKD